MVVPKSSIRKGTFPQLATCAAEVQQMTALHQGMRPTKGTKPRRRDTPTDVPKIKRPTKAKNSALTTRHLQILQEKLGEYIWTSERIVVLSGAGISVSAGTLHLGEDDPFHCLLDELARNGRLLRHYTQNIDCIEHQLSSLSNVTVYLHGRIDQTMCSNCDWRGSLSPKTFRERDKLECPRCEEMSNQRQISGKRRLGIGKLRPNILLYGEETQNSDVIGETATQDLRKHPDMLLVVGTALKVPGAKRLAKEFCQVTQAHGGLAVWVNMMPPPSGLRFKFDFECHTDCDNLSNHTL
ncbi:MAG: hypothetical protein Q9217_002661 [Psora testacea]